MRTLFLLVLSAPLAAQDADARALFVEHCATCHGVEGDGQGTTPLPKPARSFLDGGFSYGNTRAAIGRTLEHGIPGTPMPSFSAALDEARRAALVEFVIALGPPRKEVARSDTLLTVGDTPLVVRGYLPALGAGAPEFPRGLLVGLTSGTTFQYRADDVRLLAVRQGEFVERRDWGGRGGNALRPLGKVTHSVDAGKPGPMWSRVLAGIPVELRAHLTATAVRGAEVELSYDLSDGATKLASVTESPRVFRTSVGAGFERSFRIAAGPSELVLDLNWGADVLVGPTPKIFSNEVRGKTVHEWLVTYVDGSGAHQVVAVVGEDGLLHPTRVGQEAVSANRCRFVLAAGESAALRLLQVTTIDDSEATVVRFLEELYR